MTKTGTEQPRTAAGREFVDQVKRYNFTYSGFLGAVERFVLQIEAEAASPSREALAAALRQVAEKVYAERGQSGVMLGLLSANDETPAWADAILSALEVGE